MAKQDQDKKQTTEHHGEGSDLLEGAESKVKLVEAREQDTVQEDSQRKIRCVCGASSCRVGPFVDVATGDPLAFTAQEANDCGCWDG